VTQSEINPSVFHFFVDIISMNQAFCSHSSLIKKISLKAIFALLFIFYFISSCSPFANKNEITNTDGINLDVVSVTSVSPSSSFLLGGSTVTIRGTNFKSDMAVSFGNTQCLNKTFISSSQITCDIPAVSSPTTVSVHLTVSGSTVATKSNSFEYKSDLFTKANLFSGNLSFMGSTDGVSTSAKFFRPSKPLVVGSYLYISDTGNNTIRRMNLTSKLVETIAGTANASGTLNGIGSAARFVAPMGMVHISGDLYIADTDACQIRKLNLTTFEVTTIAGVANDCENPLDNAVGLNATFAYPQSIVTDGTYLYIGEDSPHIRRVSLSAGHAVDTLTFATPAVFILDQILIGNLLYFINYDGLSTYSLRRVNITDSIPVPVTNVIGLPSQSGGLATDTVNIFISASNRLRQYNIASGTATYIAGATTAGNIDAVSTTARLHAPAGLDYSGGLLYFTSLGTHNIRTYDPATGAVNTISGNTK